MTPEQIDALEALAKRHGDQSSSGNVSPSRLDMMAGGELGYITSTMNHIPT